jgi:hypothetical protein
VPTPTQKTDLSFIEVRELIAYLQVRCPFSWFRYLGNLTLAPNWQQQELDPAVLSVRTDAEALLRGLPGPGGLIQDAMRAWLIGRHYLPLPVTPGDLGQQAHS